MAIKILIIVFSLLICLEAVNGDNFSNACYGIDVACDHYTIQCPDSHVIQLQNLTAGHKNDSDCIAATHCNKSDTCCVYTVGDITEPFNLKNAYDTYSNCSGKQHCSKVHAPWQLTSTSPFVATSYVQVGYSCVEEERNISICGPGSRVRNAAIDMVYEGSKDVYNSTNPDKTCQCIISTVGQTQTVKLTVVDVRLESFHKVENQSVANCSSTVLSSSLGIIERCDETNHHYEQNFIHSKVYEETLQAGARKLFTVRNLFALDEYDAPAMIWLSVQASNKGLVQVTCKEGVFEDETESIMTTTGNTNGNHRVRHSNVALVIFILTYCVGRYILQAEM